MLLSSDMSLRILAETATERSFRSYQWSQWLRISLDLPRAAATFVGESVRHDRIHLVVALVALMVRHKVGDK